MKNPQNQDTKLVTLKHVASRASKDKDFLNALVKSPKATLKKNALKLSDTDGKKLTTMFVKYRKALNTRSDLHKYGKQLGLKPPLGRTDIWNTYS